MSSCFRREFGYGQSGQPAALGTHAGAPDVPQLVPAVEVLPWLEQSLQAAGVVEMPNDRATAGRAVPSAAPMASAATMATAVFLRFIRSPSVPVSVSEADSKSAYRRRVNTV